MKSAAVISIAVAFFACEDRYRSIQQMSRAETGPIAIGEAVNMRYTDSGRLTATLVSPKLFDFSNYEFNYTQFPDGLEVVFWDEDGNRTTVTADYGAHYDRLNLVDLRDNVVLTTSDSTVLRANQLYWDQDNQWVFTDRPYRITFPDGSYNDGERFDSDEEFTTFLSRKNIGVQIVEEETEENNVQ